MIAAQKPSMPRQLRVQAPSSQRGVTLIVGLIMLLLITLLVAGAFTLSTSNLKSVGNMQVREESIAAANQAIERLISSPFTNALGAQTFTVDIDKNGTDDYSVYIKKPECTRALQATFDLPSDVELNVTSGSSWNTDWDIDATVTDASSGSSVRVRQGIRVLLAQAQKESVCP